MLSFVIAYIRLLCVKGSYYILMFLFPCADRELRIFVYIFSSIDELPRLIPHAWILMSCHVSRIIYCILPIYLRYVVFVFL